MLKQVTTERRNTTAEVHGVFSVN